MRREPSGLRPDPAAYTSLSGSARQTFKFPEGAVVGAPVYLYVKGFLNDAAGDVGGMPVYLHAFYARSRCDEILGHGVVTAVRGKKASVGWLRMVHRSGEVRRGAAAGMPWQVGNLTEGAMDAFREIELGPGFQLIPIFRWEAPDDAFTLLDTIREQQAWPVQLLEFKVLCGDVHLSLSTLSGDMFDVIVPAGVPVFEAEPTILGAVGCTRNDDRSLDEYMLHLIMPDGRLLQSHDLLPGANAAAVSALFSAVLESS